MVNRRGIEANPEKIKALLEMSTPLNPKADAKPDRSSGENGFGTGIMLISLEGHKLHSVLHFRFRASQCCRIRSSPSWYETLRTDNHSADTLSKPTSNKDSDLLRCVKIEFLPKLTTEQDDAMFFIEESDSWIRPIFSYLTGKVLLEDKDEARKV
ncbi:Uncharacterized protein Adt_32449 [Abeliophyllum distichum]|uniref:Reverse transcriptase n=1 Tax=Abeliophyllum distichum TaxID=126358 RepID=A0ABD1QVE0_9LAMI